MAVVTNIQLKVKRFIYKIPITNITLFFINIDSFKNLYSVYNLYKDLFVIVILGSS